MNTSPTYVVTPDGEKHLFVQWGYSDGNLTNPDRVWVAHPKGYNSVMLKYNIGELEFIYGKMEDTFTT